MKFNFKIQQYQTDAVDSVVGVFKGQPYSNPVNYRRDIGKVRSAVSYSQMSFVDSMFEQQELALTDDYDDAGFKNEIVALPDAALLANIREIQQNNNVKISDKLINNLGRCSLDVEMETGTGKTYVYIKTMYELNKYYGWSKFIVVVPSIAIREGVKKSFEITQDHFMEQYGKKVRFFVYNSSNLNQLDAFSSNSGINVMIINMQAFNTSMKEGGKSKEARIIYDKRDEFGSRRPIDVIKANNPIIILDEATSALDNESEYEVAKSLGRLSEGRTTLTIAHRLSSIRNSDRILVLTHDGIVEEGNHEELLEKHGIYDQFYRMANELK